MGRYLSIAKPIGRWLNACQDLTVISVSELVREQLNCLIVSHGMSAGLKENISLINRWQNNLYHNGLLIAPLDSSRLIATDVQRQCNSLLFVAMLYTQHHPVIHSIHISLSLFICSSCTVAMPTLRPIQTSIDGLIGSFK